MQQIGLPPPFWAFAWAGGQGLARYILDNPETVRGKRVLDFASGSGLVGIAAVQGRRGVGARRRHRSVLRRGDPAQCAGPTASAVDFTGADCIGTDGGWDVVLAGDVFYEKPFAERLVPWFGQLAARGADILVGDPGRSYLPKERLQAVAVYQVPVTRALEDADVKRTTVWRFA